jgi:lipopolysaccharide export LptBFGC system permease protein LptF
MTDDEKEALWLKNKPRLLKESKEYQEALQAFKMSSGADWLLFAIPVAAGIVFINSVPIHPEWLLWLCTVGVAVVIFAICVFVKSLTISGRLPTEIEKDIKERFVKQLDESTFNHK